VRLFLSGNSDFSSANSDQTRVSATHRRPKNAALIMSC
jgi:hypothetical protein